MQVQLYVAQCYSDMEVASSTTTEVTHQGVPGTDFDNDLIFLKGSAAKKSFTGISGVAQWLAC